MQTLSHTANGASTGAPGHHHSVPATRDLLVFGPGSSARLVVNAIERYGWRPRIASDPTDAKRLNEEQRFKVGIVVMEHESEDELDHAQAVVTALPLVKWIAVLPRAVPKHDSVLFFIAEHTHDFQHLPIDPLRLSIVLGHTYGMASIEERSRFRQERFPVTTYGMIGSSPPMKRLYLEIARAAASDAPVLIVGETGTGKEMVARAIHSSSARSNGPFVVLNCAAVPASLMHSELFGHERGAFTHAFERKPGRVEIAAGGTLLLDEIGEMPEETQAILLRFLEEKTVTRLGATGSLPVDVRIIAATNRDLEQCVRDRTFRHDLFYRLAVLVIKTPPLRDRGDDIEDLAKNFLAAPTWAGGAERLAFTPEALASLRRCQWPGNLRELRSRIVQAAFQAEGTLITANDLGLPGPSERQSAPARTLQEARNIAERDTLELALQRNEGNVSRAAKQLRISRMTLYRLLEKHHIRVER